MVPITGWGIDPSLGSGELTVEDAEGDERGPHSRTVQDDFHSIYGLGFRV